MLRYFTVEYDGYTYKREEVKEEEAAPGVQYLVSSLGLSNSEKTELEKIINRMHTKSKWKDMSDKQERIYSKMEKILSKLKSYTPFSVPFLSKVSKREAPEYYNLIKTPIDLGKIGKKLLMQEYSDVNDFSKDLDLIWENCFKFNSTHGNVYAMYAQKMKEKAHVLLQDLFSEREIEIEGTKEEREHFLRTEKQRKEMVATRTATLQNPGEFTCKRTPEGMGEYWKEEMRMIEEGPKLEQDTECMPDENTNSQGPSSQSTDEYHEKKKVPEYLPEYKHFYNSFPVCTYAPVNPPFSEYSIDHQFAEGAAGSSRHMRSQKTEENTQDKKIFYIDGSYITQDGNTVDSICIRRAEVLHILKRVVALELLSMGFTSSESSALNVLVSFIMHRLESTVKQISEYKRKPRTGPSEKTSDELIRQIIHNFRIKTLDPYQPQFFSEDEEETDEESIINIIYSNPEDAEIEIDEDII